MVEAFIGLGSNLGNRKKNIDNSLRILNERKNVELVGRASNYETEPIGPTQPWFINTAVEIATTSSPEEILAACKEVEKRIGRVDSLKWGPRLVDLDLLLVNGYVLEERDLKLPHPQMEERRFVLLPLLELEPNLVHPKLQTPLKDLLPKLEEDKKVIKLQ
ncbi:2-amino-4-hydroxy-6-hydroxymethyldihydropteridine diphosphokinase [Candidatus Bipolaricaulota bacterium]|nr:2-amino-4-hydroxy-6-hydroxymethyldihydropteridine diphosphokinase [Candidatus Bipolaricaulota bacterium]